jgi:hypothetical protein
VLRAISLKPLATTALSAITITQAVSNRKRDAALLALGVAYPHAGSSSGMEFEAIALQVHPDKALRFFQRIFHLSKPLTGLGEITRSDVPVELDDDRAMDTFGEPLYDFLIEPIACFSVERNIELGATGPQIVCIGKDGPFKLKGNRSDLGVVR